MKRILVLIVFFAVIVGCGKEKKEPISSESGLNRAPEVIAAKTTPIAPKAGTPLKVTVEVNDPDGDPVTLSYKWYVSDRLIPVEKDDALDPKFVRKGDNIFVEITPTDGKLTGTPFLAQFVSIGNTPPEIVSVNLKPRLVYPGYEIKVNTEVRDVDGDPISYIFKWRRNGIAIEGETSETLQTKGFKKMDLVVVTVIPFDGESRGRPVRSLPIVIANRPPEITSFPNTDVTNGKYTYKVQAVDPDGDTLKFSLDEPLSNMTIDQTTGIIQWDIPPDSSGSYNVKVLVSDGDAKAFQSFELLLP